MRITLNRSLTYRIDCENVKRIITTRNNELLRKLTGAAGELSPILETTERDIHKWMWNGTDNETHNAMSNLSLFLHTGGCHKWKWQCQRRNPIMGWNHINHRRYNFATIYWHFIYLFTYLLLFFIYTFLYLIAYLLYNYSFIYIVSYTYFYIEIVPMYSVPDTREEKIIKN